jgi:hypothetical protein
MTHDPYDLSRFKERRHVGLGMQIVRDPVKHPDPLTEEEIRLECRKMALKTMMQAGKEGQDRARAEAEDFPNAQFVDVEIFADGKVRQYTWDEFNEWIGPYFDNLSVEPEAR